MQVVNIHQAKSQLSKLIEYASQSDEVIIAKDGKPVAKLVAIAAERPVRRPGAMEEKIKIADDFDAPLPDDIHQGFEGN